MSATLTLEVISNTLTTAPSATLTLDVVNNVLSASDQAPPVVLAIEDEIQIVAGSETAVHLTVAETVASLVAVAEQGPMGPAHGSVPDPGDITLIFNNQLI